MTNGTYAVTKTETTVSGPDHRRPNAVGARRDYRIALLDTFHLPASGSSKFQNRLDELMYEYDLGGGAYGDGDAEMPCIGGFAWGYTGYVDLSQGIDMGEYEGFLRRIGEEYNPGGSGDYEEDRFERKFLRRVRGAIVNHTSSGAVYVSYFGTRDDYKRAVECTGFEYHEHYRTTCTGCGNTLEGHGEVLTAQDASNGCGNEGDPRWTLFDEPLCRRCALTGHEFSRRYLQDARDRE